MLFAIVDIETTGGYAASNGITEIAVFVSDGKNVLQEFHTLLNPVYTIPKFVERLTGITNEMVETERAFGSIADELYELLSDKVFVAHNVNFDFSFINYHLGRSGYNLSTKKLCTIRFARQVVPGLRGYGLEKICNHLEIPLNDRHRASGDAAATTQLFHWLIENDRENHLEEMLKLKSKEQFLPPNLAAVDIKTLPHSPGVYYFHNKKGKVIYVGKARNIFKRVNSHFSNNKSNRQKQEFLKSIYTVTYKKTATELMAFILESIEIKKYWPEQNRSQKRLEPAFGLYYFEDANGYLRLCIDKKKKNIPALYTFNLLMEGYSLLKKMVTEFDLCPMLCFLHKEHIVCSSITNNMCKGACEKKETAEDYNSRVNSCIEHFRNELPTFAVVEEGFNEEEKSLVLIENGKFYGMGYVPESRLNLNISQIKSHLTPMAENDYIRGLIYSHAERFPLKKFELCNQLI